MGVQRAGAVPDSLNTSKNRIGNKSESLYVKSVQGYFHCRSL